MISSNRQNLKIRVLYCFSPRRMSSVTGMHNQSVIQKRRICCDVRITWDLNFEQRFVSLFFVMAFEMAAFLKSNAFVVTVEGT